ncbi:hypothetical protein OY671_011573, partial [Metschnikowia pulcherrima]
FVRQLTKNGYVVNEPSKSDRRAGGLWITEDGERVSEQSREIIAAHERESTACLSEDERAESFRSIIQVCASAPAKD